MERVMEALELMMMSVKELEQVDYVHETLKKYKKLNPLIAKSNTLLADRENINRFDDYATDALELFYSIKETELKENRLYQILAGVLLEEYQKECKALEERLAIYDSSLREEAYEKRRSHISRLEQWLIPDARKKVKHLIPLLEENVELKREKIRCKNKITANQEVFESYSRKLLFRKNAQKTAQQAREYIKQHEAELKKVENRLTELEQRLLIECTSGIKEESPVPAF